MPCGTMKKILNSLDLFIIFVCLASFFQASMVTRAAKVQPISTFWERIRTDMAKQSINTPVYSSHRPYAGLLQSSLKVFLKINVNPAMTVICSMYFIIDLTISDICFLVTLSHTLIKK